MGGWEKELGKRVRYRGQVGRIVRADSGELVLEAEERLPHYIFVEATDWQNVELLDPECKDTQREGALVC